MPNRSRFPPSSAEPASALVSLLTTLSAFHRSRIPRYGLSLGQYLGLRFVVTHAPVRISALARVALVSPPTATAFVDGMERRGWVRRSRSREDRRVVVVIPTPKALRTLHELDAEQRALFRRAFQRIPAQDRERAAVWLNEVGKVVEAELGTDGYRRREDRP